MANKIQITHDDVWRFWEAHNGRVYEDELYLINQVVQVLQVMSGKAFDPSPFWGLYKAETNWNEDITEEAIDGIWEWFFIEKNHIIKDED